MGLRNEFIAWFNNDFQKDPLWAPMETCVEASSWHRENSVATHTRMVVSEYISWADKKWSHNTLLGAVACAFHDTGKPAARTEKYSEKRGKYNSFGGHEIISARLWEDYAVRNQDRLKKLFRVSTEAFYRIMYGIGVIIEHHMPYEQSGDKLKDITITINELDITNAFVNHLTADTHGRIADDHPEKIAAVDQWIEDFLCIDNFKEVRITDKTIFMPVAPSGSGKSTLRVKLQDSIDFEYYSWDALRLEMYDSDYKKAYEMSVKDNGFNNKVMKVYYELLKTGKNIYIDNTNLGRRRRAPYIDAARKAGYQVHGFLLPNTIETLLYRQTIRGDKEVPEHAVRQHYMSLQLPLYGEFDNIQTIVT